MEKHSSKDEYYINALKEGGPAGKKVLGELYRDHHLFQRVVNFITYKGGSEEDARMFFVDGLVTLERNIRYGKFKGDSSVKTYLYSIIKWMWLQSLRQRSVNIVLDESSINEKVDFQNPELMMISEELKLQLQGLLDLIGEKCKKLLKYWSHSYTSSEIAALLNLSDEQNVRKQKFYCKQKLVELVRSNPEIIPSIYYE